MKSKFLLTLVILFGQVFICFSQSSIAVVNKIQGFYIFTDCQPLAEYDAIGEVTTDGNNDLDIINSGGQYQPVRDYLIKTARQTYYSADGIILSLVNIGASKAVIIKFKENATNKNHAKANQYQGLYIFVDSEPLDETEYIGTIKSRMSLSGDQYVSVRDKLIRKCKSDHKDAKGLIIKFVSGGTDTGDAIKFKNQTR